MIMGELPEKFPEYSIMYRTISNQIKNHYKTKRKIIKITKLNRFKKIKKYQEELEKIKKMFPDNFFEN